MRPQGAPVFGDQEKGQVVRPDFWHDPNVGAVGCLIAFLLALLLLIALCG